MSGMSRVEKKVAELAGVLGVEWEVQDEGFVPRKGERIVKSFRGPAFGLLKEEEWQEEKEKWVQKIKEEDRRRFNKIVYKTATRKGASRLYLVAVK